MEKNRVVAYIFYSTNDNKKVEQYRQSIIEFAKEKLKISETQIDFYVDNTKKGDRVERNKLIVEIRKHRYNVLIVYHCNQLCKITNIKGLNKCIDMQKLLQIRDIILNNGVKIYSVKENKSIE